MFLKLSLKGPCVGDVGLTCWSTAGFKPQLFHHFYWLLFFVFNLAAKQMAFGDFRPASESAVLEQRIRAVLVFHCCFKAMPNTISNLSKHSGQLN